MALNRRVAELRRSVKRDARCRRLQRRPEADNQSGQRNRHESVLEEHGDHHSLGRLGRLMRQCSAAAGLVHEVRLPRTDDRDIVVREAA